MNIDDIKNKFTNLVDIAIYKSNSYTEEEEKDLEEIRLYFKNKKDVLEDIKHLLNSRTNENYIAFNNLLIEILTRINKDIKLNILYNSDIYIDFIKEKSVFLRIWQTFSKKDKLKYLVDKKKCNDMDYYLFNESIKEKTSFRENFILKEIIDNKVVRDKIPNLSLDVVYSPSTINNLDLSDYELCSKFTKSSYTNLVIKSCSVLSDFVDLVTKNKKIVNLIERNSIIFKNTENKEVAQYLKDNIDMIGKFNIKYLNFFDNEEIESIYNKKELTNETYSTLLDKMYNLYPDKVDTLITESNLSKCVKHSLNIYPFEKMNSKNKDIIFNNYNLFNRFIDTIMIEAISNNYSEEEILNVLRNPVFIKDQSSYAIELLLNKLSFKSAFNMLQIKMILDSITNLNVNVDKTDTIFIKGYLDSPSLIIKTDHNMLLEMLSLLTKDDVLYYIICPYIANQLTSSEIIELAIIKEISIDELLNSQILTDKLNKDDYITYIDRIWNKKVDLSIFNNKELVHIIFNLSYEDIDKIDFSEVNYLFETIKMKSILSKQIHRCTVITYKSVLAAYLTLGIDKTIKMVTNGNKDITLKEVFKIKDTILDERILLFKENNAILIQNLHLKIANILNKITYTNKMTFIRALKKNTYLDNIMYLMLESNYCSFNTVVDAFYDYLRIYNDNPYLAKKDLYHFCNGFVEALVRNQYSKLNVELFDKMRNNFRLKENVLYKKRREIGKEFIEKQKLKVFVRALTDSKPENYAYALTGDFPITELKEKYIEFLNKEQVNIDDIINEVLIPLVEDKFNKYSYLSKIGINKPKEYDVYCNYINNVNIVNNMNKSINKLKTNHSKADILSIMECLRYCKEINIVLSTRDKKRIKKLANVVENFRGELYIDKKELKYIYGDNLDVYNTNIIFEYNSYLDIINEIINKTNRFVTKYIDSQKIENYYREEYLKKISTEDFCYPLNNKYYEPIIRVLSLKDIEKIFNGYKLDDYKKSNDILEDFLFNKHNLIMVAEGYYDGIVDNLGLIISNFDKIVKEFKRLYPNEEISLIKAEKVVRLINYRLSIISKSIEPDIINSIFDDDYYIDGDISLRLNNLEYVYKESFKKVSSTIPYISVNEDEYEATIVDNYNQEMYRSEINTNYRIGARGNDFLHYAILNKNGAKVIIKKKKTVIGRLLGLRHGNTVFFNKVEGQFDDNYERVLHKLASELIRVTKDSNEPIEFVTILINKVLKRSYGLRIDSTICPIIDNPLSKEYNDYQEFRKSRYLNTINADGFYNNYKEKVSTILASSVVLDKNNFKYYDAEAKYLRNRNKVLKLSNNLEDYYINKINTIIGICNMEGTSEFIGDVKLSTIDTIYLGDDFVIFITNNKQLFKYVLPYDNRAYNEVKLIIDSLNQKDC